MAKNTYKKGLENHLAHPDLCEKKSETRSHWPKEGTGEYAFPYLLPILHRTTNGNEAAV